MPADITDVSEYTDPIVVPTNGDAVNGEGLLELAQGLSNRTAYLHDAVLGLGTGGAAYANNLNGLYNPSSRFAFIPDTIDSEVVMGWSQTSVTDAGMLLFKLDTPKVGTLDAVIVKLAHSGTHSGMPGTMPNIKVYSQSYAVGPAARVELDTQVDTSANETAYESLHSITIFGLGAVCAEGVEYFLELTGENGANKQPGLMLIAIETVVF